MLVKKKELNLRMIKIVTIKSKDVGEVRDVIRRECEVVRTFEDRSQDWIKRDLGVGE